MSHSKGSGDDKVSAEEQGALFGTAAVKTKIADDKAGHRQRLRERFSNGGADAVPDYELLEMILFRAFPRIDTKPIAKRLLARFGSFAEVVSAPPERLKEIEGVGNRAVEELKLIKTAAERLTKVKSRRARQCRRGAACSIIFASRRDLTHAKPFASSSSTRKTI